MWRWERREQKREAKRRRMRVTGRGLLTVVAPAERKRLRAIIERAGRSQTPGPTEKAND